MSASTSVLQCEALVKEYGEDPTSLRYVAGGARNILVAFVDNFEYSSLMLFQNTVSGISLGSFCDMATDNMLISFSHFVFLKSFGLS